MIDVHSKLEIQCWIFISSPVKRWFRWMMKAMAEVITQQGLGFDHQDQGLTLLHVLPFCGFTCSIVYFVVYFKVIFQLACRRGMVSCMLIWSCEVSSSKGRLSVGLYWVLYLSYIFWGGITGHRRLGSSWQPVTVIEHGTMYTLDITDFPAAVYWISLGGQTFDVGVNPRPQP